MRRRRSSLGGLLLKQLRRRGRTVSAGKRAKRRPLRARPEFRFLAETPVTASPAGAPLPAPVAPQVTLVAQPSPRLAAPPETSLLTEDLVRPDERLRRSIEGFLLDQRSEHTRRAYGKDLHRFTKFLLARRMDRAGLEALDRSVLIAYKDALLSEGLQHTTVDRHLATLRSFFQWLVDDGVIARSPAEGVRFLNPRKLSTTQGFSDEEVRRMLALPNAHTRTGAQHLAILAVLFYCGLRRSEVCELRTSSLSVERGHPVVRLRGKGNVERVIPLVPQVWRPIQHHLRISGRAPTTDAWLFSAVKNGNAGEKPLDPSMIFYLVTKLAREAGVANRVSPHSCRATAISNARDHHVPDRAIQEFAGWSSTQMITRYDKRKTAIEESAAHAIRYGEDPDPEKPA